MKISQTKRSYININFLDQKLDQFEDFETKLIQYFCSKQMAESGC